jgi:hypothetical protein
VRGYGFFSFWAISAIENTRPRIRILNFFMVIIFMVDVVQPLITQKINVVW